MTTTIVRGHECDLPKSYNEKGDIEFCDECGTYWSYNPDRVFSGWRRVRSRRKVARLDAIRLGEDER